MHGRRFPHLLALLLSFLLLPLSILSGQSDHSTPAPDFAFVPGPVQPPSRPIIPTPQFSTPFGLSQLTRAAGTIFSGTVTSIVPSPATREHTIETLAITFHVENAIRGATPGTDFTFRQWIGLWSAGQRYRVGERVLLFLYPPSKLGLTSCVAAPVGRFSMNASGKVTLTGQQIGAFRADPILSGKSRISFSDFASAVQASLVASQQANQE
jgi:hypothetical protein